MRVSSVLSGLAAGIVLAATLTGCSTTVPLDPPPHADNAKCADLIVSMRSVPVLGGFDRVWTDAQSTAAWGDPTAIIMACGVEPVAASQLPCETVGGIDWVIDNTDPKYYRMTSFGREPAVQVFIDLEALRKEQLDGNSSKDSDAGAVISRFTRYMTDFQRTGACTERPAS